MNSKLTISICQFPIAFLNWEKNQEKALSYIKQAQKEQSDLIIFPEMTLTGISKNISTMSDSNQKSISFFKKAAIDSHIAIGFGWGKPAGEKLENHYTIIDEYGNILSDYIKIHPFTYGGEDLCFVRGSSFNTFSYKDFTIATFICYDMRFPEIFQAASKKADLIILCANWPKARNMHWKVLSQARAIENQVYFAACNCVGEVGGLLYSGDSTLYSPEGKIIKSLSETEGLITCTITNDVSSIRKGFPVKQDRLTDYYKSIL
ncbi:MAG: nitrilase-related carbon-nitrogen hydrolase [Lachnospiraceae bacterium]|nr:nitrilase-related carbon-nitrogen hydrolase [Lachnospiraceae bacterium]